MRVGKGLEGGGQRALSGLGAGVDVVGAIRHDLLRNARKGSALATKAAETCGTGSVFAAKAVENAENAVEAQGKGSVFAAKAVDIQGKGSVLAAKAVGKQRPCLCHAGSEYAMQRRLLA